MAFVKVEMLMCSSDPKDQAVCDRGFFVCMFGFFLYFLYLSLLEQT